MRSRSPLIPLMSLACLLAATDLSGQVYIIPIEGTIDLGLPPFIERIIAQAEVEKPDLIIFDIDTFGGRLDGATRIKDTIMGSSIPTVAFINRRAISAGALISLACERIIMTSGATIGAATAVDLEGKKATEKVISYMREEMSSTAEARGRPGKLAEAMVDEEIELPWIVINGDSLSLAEVEGSKKDKLVTLTTQRAIAFGIADSSFDSIEEFLAAEGLGGIEVISFEPSWSERMVRFLTDPIVSSLLMSIGFIGLIFELKSPGFGVGGIIGVTALSLFFGATFLAELATVSELLIFLAGVSLMLAELFVIPGFGVAGVAGIGLMLWGMFKMLLGEYPTPEQMERAFLGLNIGIVGGVLAIVLLLRIIVLSRFFRENVPIKSEDASVSIGLEALVGKQGVTITPCRPSGKAEVEGQIINIITRGEILEAGVKLKVLAIEGNVAKVAPVDA